MKPDFSESSYAYAVTREVEAIANRSLGGLTGPPLIPSLQHERDLGYDVELATVTLSVFIQFKLGWYVSRPHPDSPTWPHVGVKHYRVEFPVGHHQLPALQALEAGGTTSGLPALVRYIAPQFRDAGVFATHFKSSSVLNNSYGCSPSDVPADGLRHHLVTATTLAQPLVLSEPTPIPNAAAAELLRADIVEATESALAVAGTPPNLRSIEQVLRSACVGTNLVPADLDTTFPDVSTLDIIGTWATLLDVIPMIWLVAGDAQDVKPDNNSDSPTQRA